MPLSIFPVAPEAGSPVFDGDVSHDQVKSAAVPAVQTGFLVIGTHIFASVWLQDASFMRFEVDIPKGAEINAVKLLGMSNGATAGTTLAVTGGFVLPDTLWETANGVAAWTAASSMPFAEWNEGANSDASVWVGGAPAFASAPSVIVSSSGDDYSLGDGMVATTQVNGLVAQLQSYLDDPAIEILRGSVVAGAIPTMFQLYQPWNGEGDNFQDVFSSSDATPSNRPELHVDWRAPGASTVRGSVIDRPRLTTTFRGQ